MRRGFDGFQNEVVMRYYRAKSRKENRNNADQFVHRIELLDYICYLKQIPHYKLDKEVENWCEENFGLKHQDWTYIIHGFKDKKILICFKSKEDVMAFKLRWL